MKHMRKFYMVNSIGERIDLNDREGYLFTNPSGLGLTYDVSQADLEGGFYKRTKIQYPSQTIIGDLLILGDSYQRYRDFVNWINKGKEISFVYRPFGTTEFYIDIEIESLEKTEINQYDCLICSLNMNTKTPWYSPNVTVINVTPEIETNASRFDLQFDFAFVNDNTAGSISVSANGHIPSSIKIEIPGPVYNPSIELYKGSDLLGKMKLYDTAVSSGSTLVYSSLYTNSGVWIDDASQIDKLDLANNNFFRIPLGDNYDIKIVSDQQVPISAKVFVYDYFRSV